MKNHLLILALAALMLPAQTFAQYGSGYSNASLNGPWIVLSDNYTYILFDGNGHIIQLGLPNDTVSPVGTYSVTSGGAVAATLNLVTGPAYVTGNMDNDTIAIIYIDTAQGPWSMLAVTNPGGLAGTWTGYIYDSTLMTNRNISLVVNSSGAITSASGISLIAGNIFEGESSFAGYMTTSDSDCTSKNIQLYGPYFGGDTLWGNALLGPQNGGNCSHTGDFFLTKSTTGIPTINHSGGFSVYPNPFSNQIEIAVKNPGNNIEVDLFDMLGRKMYTDSYREGNVQNININNLSALSNGVYLLRLTIDNQVYTQKIIKN